MYMNVKLNNRGMRLLPMSVISLALMSCGGENKPGESPTQAIGSPPITIENSNTAGSVFPMEIKSTLPRNASPDIVDTQIIEVAQAVSRFGLNVYDDWAKQAENTTSNFVFSPLSLYSALLMVQTGAESETLQQIGAVLNSSESKEIANARFNALDLAVESRDLKPGDATVRNTNALFVNKSTTVLPPFLDALAIDFGAGVLPIDLSSAELTNASLNGINAWFSQKTAGKFPQFLGPGSLDLAKLVIANAVSFKGAWKFPFDTNVTTEREFELLSGELKTTSFMTQDVVVRVAEFTNYTAVALPFAGDEFEIQIVTPNSGQFESVESQIFADPTRDLFGEATPQFARIVLPKFSFELELLGAETLSRLGMPSAFDSTKADFSGIDGSRNLYISKVVHKAAIAVDENGAEASAGTAIVLTPPSGPNVTIAMDRPFIFAIRDDKTGLLVFIGRVLDPTL